MQYHPIIIVDKGKITAEKAVHEYLYCIDSLPTFFTPFQTP